MKRTAGILASLLVLAAARAEITFSTPHINDSDEILFQVTHHKPGEPSYPTFFIAGVDQDSVSPQQITSYPQRLSSLMGGSSLRIRNRYGTSHYNMDTGSLLHSSHNHHSPIPTESVIPAAESVSPDGNWICDLQRTGPVTARIILRSAAGYTEVELVAQTEMSFVQVPVRWSPDSKFLVYEKEGSLYFTEPESMFKSNQVPEDLRRIGPGSISCVDWASEKNLVYITNDLVYRIPIYEMYTRALYSDFVGIGTVVGRLPHPFTSTDTFSVNEDCTAMVVAGHQRTISYLSLPGTATFVRQLYTGTQVSLVGSTQDCRFFWDKRGNPILWFQYHKVGKTSSKVYRLEIHGGQVKAVMLQVEENAAEPLLSPDRQRLLWRTEDKLQVYEVDTWSSVDSLDCRQVIDYDWGSKDRIFVGTEEAVLGWNVGQATQNNVSVLFPVSATSYSWSTTTGNPLLETPWGIMEYHQESGSWDYSTVVEMEAPKTANGSYRTFLDTSPNRNFTNMPYIRTLTGAAVTKALYPPAAKEQVERPQVVLAFDAVDNADGVAVILQTLERYNIRSTFFINGEFIRRYPAETGRIVEAGHECGSMFHTAIDLTANEDFLINESFVRRGLARNEDEFYHLTERELSVIWHAPHYQVSQQALDAGVLAGYTYVDRSLDPMDGVTFQQAAVTDITTYKPSATIISDIVERLEDGMMIPVAVGVSGGTREDYLYHKLDLLIAAILDAGYDIVSVGQALNK